MLKTSAGPLDEAHDLVMFDLDGVVYVSGKAVPRVVNSIERLRERGRPIAFVTNNASRTPEAVVKKLKSFGVPATAADVVTSAQAAARLLAEEFGRGARVLLLGGEGLRRALVEQGLDPVEEPEEAVALVSGYGPDVRWRDIMQAASAVRNGLPYVASNADLTIPTSDGPAPGHGVLVRTISDFAGVEPRVAGKPEKPLMVETVRRIGGERPIMVGDRLDTDIEGARAIDAASLLVLTGVTRLPELVAAPAHQRPDYISADTSGLFVEHRAPEMEQGAALLGGWRATTESGSLHVSGAGSEDDWWRVAAAAAWHHLDRHGEPVDVLTASPPGPDPGSISG